MTNELEQAEARLAEAITEVERWVADEQRVRDEVIDAAIEVGRLRALAEVEPKVAAFEAALDKAGELIAAEIDRTLAAREEVQG